jgi:brefeldin A-inhibited guanine nucleotide-exchange protein
MEALGCLTKILKALGDWVEQNSSTGSRENQQVAHEMKSKVTKHVGDNNDSILITPTKVDASNLVQKKLDKSEFQEGVKLFNKKPKKGIAHLKAIGKLGEGTPADIANFLKTAPNLDKTVVGDYLGEREDESLKVMRAYVDAMDFSGFGLDEAIRKFLEGFRLPGESQKIDRLMEKFAARFHAQNPTQYRSADTAYVLAFSVIMLNTDAHNPGVKNKMTKEGFLKNNRGIDDGQDLDQEELGALYDRIVNNEIKLKDENAKKANNNDSSCGIFGHV